MSASDTYILLPGIEYTETVNVGIVVSLFERQTVNELA